MTAPAFPHDDYTIAENGNFDHRTLPGLTKREYAAIHIAAAIAGRKVVFTELEAEFAKTAVALADAVLREAGE